MLFSEKSKLFEAAHPCAEVTVDGARFRYVVSGNEGGRTLVFLNGGMNTLGMWMDYVDGLSDEYRVLLFDYPQELRTNQELVIGMHAFVERLNVKEPVFIGASDGGMVAQIYVQEYPGEAGGLVLISTGGMDEAKLKSLKKLDKTPEEIVGFLDQVIQDHTRGAKLRFEGQDNGPGKPRAMK